MLISVCFFVKCIPRAEGGADATSGCWRFIVSVTDLNKKLKSNKSNKTMDDSGCPSSGRQSGSLRGLEDPSPVPPQRTASVVKNAVKSCHTRGGKSVNLPPSGAARIKGKWAVLAAAARWQRRQSSGSKAAAARRRRAAQRRRWRREDNGGSAAAAGRCLRAHGGSSVAAMSGAEGRQDIGGSCYSRAVAAVAARRGVCTRALAALQRRRRGGDASAAAAGWCERQQRVGSCSIAAAAAQW
jgi:hypothetical protein